MITAKSSKWFFETTTAVEGHMHAIVRTIAEARTKFQHVEIMETASYGKALVLDGRIQSSQADEFIYHEALVHPGLLLLDAPPTSALVIGGGEGATLREILRYPSIQKAVMVDIDAEVVELCKRHLPEMHQGAFDDPRTEFRAEDARGYLERTAERFDLIVVDLVEPLEEGPACLLFTREFYGLVRDRLSPGWGHDHAGGHDEGRRAGLLHQHPPHPARGVPGGGRLPDLHLLLRHALGVHRRLPEERSLRTERGRRRSRSSPTAWRGRWLTGTDRRTATPSVCRSSSAGRSTRRRASSPTPIP